MKRSHADPGTFPVRLLKAVLVAPIHAYQRFISPALGQRCKYYPSCSAYAVEAIREVGPIRGSILAAWRLLRCNPFSHGGYDPIENRPFFRPKAKRSPAGAARRRTRERGHRERRESGHGGSAPSAAIQAASPSERARLPVIGSASKRERSISRA